MGWSPPESGIILDTDWFSYNHVARDLLTFVGKKFPSSQERTTKRVGRQTFSIKGQTESILGFVGYVYLSSSALTV